MGHLEEVGTTYWQHMRFAAQFGLVLVLVGLCVLVHAVVPALFKNTGSGAVRAMAEVLEEEGL